MSDSNKALQTIFKDMGVVLLPDTATHRLRMEIESESSGNVYVVSQRMKKDGTTQFECGCRGWIFHRKCKHLTAMTPALEQAVKLLDGGAAPKAAPAAIAAPKAAPAKKAATPKAPKAAPAPKVAAKSNSLENVVTALIKQGSITIEFGSPEAQAIMEAYRMQQAA
jgi:hypothetical protein